MQKKMSHTPLKKNNGPSLIILWFPTTPFRHEQLRSAKGPFEVRISVSTKGWVMIHPLWEIRGILSCDNEIQAITSLRFCRILIIPLVGSTPIHFTEPKATFVFSYEAVTYIMPDEFDFRSRASSTNPYQETPGNFTSWVLRGWWPFWPMS